MYIICFGVMLVKKQFSNIVSHSCSVNSDSFIYDTVLIKAVIYEEYDSSSVQYLNCLSLWCQGN